MTNLMEKNEGVFEVVDSFAIRRRSEFYLIGQLKTGSIRENWFIKVSLNSSLDLSFKISEIEEVEMSTEKNVYKLIIIRGEEEIVDTLLGLNIGSESLSITKG